MFVKPFAYERATTVGEACEILRAHGGMARVIAGGQSLLPMMNLGLLDLDAVVDVSHVEGARWIRADDGYLVLGALTRHADVERDAVVRERQPLLAEAVRWIGSPRVRTVGTVGGSLAHSDPAAELPLVMTVLGAEYRVTDGSRSHDVPASEFHVSYFATALEDAELIDSVRVPALGPGWGSAFVEVSRRLGDFAIVAAAALARVADGRVVEARVALSGVADRPIRLGAVEATVSGATLAELDARVGPIDEIDPVSDTSASADYRRHLSRVLTVRALTQAFGRAEEGAA